MSALRVAADVLSAIFLLTGALLCVAAGIGLLRFPDLFSRVHAATKPQVLGLLLILAAVALELAVPADLPTLALVLIFQMSTVPISAHMISRTAYRAGGLRHDTLLVDEPIPDLPGDPPPPGSHQ